MSNSAATCVSDLSAEDVLAAVPLRPGPRADYLREALNAAHGRGRRKLDRCLLLSVRGDLPRALLGAPFTWSPKEPTMSGQ